MDKMSTNFLTVAQAAALLNVSNRRVVAMIKSGILEAEKFGEKVWQVNAESVERRKKAMEGKKYTVYLFGEKHETDSLKKARRISQGALNYCQPPDNQIIERATGKSIPIMDDIEDEH